MENKNIIIILVAIIIILSGAIGFALLNPLNAKEPCKVLITSDKEQYEGGEISIVLAGLNKTPISKEIVNVTITNSKGKVVYDQVVKTNSKGKAKLDLNLKKGIYKVVVAYGGNENYTGNNTTQKLIIKEEVVEVAPSVSSTSYDENYLEGPEVDSHGVTKEMVLNSGIKDVKYDEENGIYVSYDPNTGTYHD